MTPATPGYKALAGVTLAGYAVMGLWSMPRIRDAANGLAPFDVRFSGYSLGDAQAFLAALSEEGRQFYGGLQSQLDAIFPPLLFATLAIGLWHLTPNFRTVTRFMLIVVPGIGMIFDAFENAQVRQMLIAGADGVTAELVGQASTFTVIKAAGFLVAIASLLVVFLLSKRARS